MSQPIKNMLVCLDGSDDSLKALDYAIELANQIKADITLLEVVEREGAPLPGYYKGASSDQDITTFMVNQKIETLLPRLDELQTSFDRRVRSGYVAEEILKEADEGSYDVIVMGTHGTGPVTRFLVGSVSTKVLHHAKVPVLVVR